MLERVQERIRAACERAGRDPAGVELVAVTKGHETSAIREAILEGGVRNLGENRIQEWRDKAAQLEGEEIRWHFIGNLQRNKVKYCLPFHLIHSVNSVRLANELQRVGERREHHFDVLVEVNVAGEETKQGVHPGGLDELVEHVRQLPNVRVHGLMTMAPWFEEAEQSREVFRALREAARRLDLPQLSMGMSNDFEIAVEEGATIVRVGSALFEEEPQ